MEPVRFSSLGVDVVGAGGLYQAAVLDLEDGRQAIGVGLVGAEEAEIPRPRVVDEDVPK